MSGPLAGRRIVIGVAGGIAAYKMPLVLRLLTGQGAQVQAVLTPAATRFVTPTTLEVLSGRPVLVDIFDKSPDFAIPHVHMAAWADAVLLAPATADLIGKLACGLGDDLLSTLMLSAVCPVVVAPAMEENMWRNPAVERNCQTLRQRGWVWVEPEVGPLASGASGKGRLPAAETLVAALQEALGGQRDLEGLRLVVSAGPTVEDLDPVRFISNRSSGKMGFAIAQRAAARGAAVVLVAGPTDLETPPGAQRRDVRSALQMKAALKEAFAEADAAVLAAAVADYRPAEVATQKIKRGGEPPSLRLVENPDISAHLGRIKGDRIVVPFAMETEKGRQRALEKLRRKKGDFIVLNDLGQPGAGFGVDTNVVTFIDPDGQAEELPQMSKLDVADRILDRVRGLWRP